MLGALGLSGPLGPLGKRARSGLQPGTATGPGSLGGPAGVGLAVRSLQKHLRGLALILRVGLQSLVSVLEYLLQFEDHLAFG